MEFIWKPAEIERKSFEIISDILGDKQIDERHRNVIMRVIHTTADFDYADNLAFSENAVELALEALKGGANIVTDTQMAKAGINKKSLAALGCSINCYIGLEEVAAKAKENSTTRSLTAVEYAFSQLEEPIIYIVGNAPTALIKLHEMIIQKKCKPSLIIGAPVGFVNVVEAKELITQLEDIPYIVAKGRKGGSNVAAAICNALLYELSREV